MSSALPKLRMCLREADFTHECIAVSVKLYIGCGSNVKCNCSGEAKSMGTEIHSLCLQRYSGTKSFRADHRSPKRNKEASKMKQNKS